MKKSHFQRILALVLMLCVLLSVCSVLSACNGCGGDDCEHANLSVINKKAATCGAAGYTGDTVCNDCGEKLSTGSTIPALTAHTWNDGVVTKEPTCSVTGIKTFTCTTCLTTKVEAVPTVAHSGIYHDDGAGKHIITCNTCTVDEKQVHNPVDDGIAFSATCTEPAYILHTCKECNAQYKEYSETELALSHNFSEWVLIDSTCKSEGSRTQTCQNPGCTEVNSIPIPVASTHNMEFIGYENDVAPNCVNGAVALYECKDCHDVTSTKELGPTGVHNYVEENSDGDFSIKRCTVCNTTISSFSAKDKVAATVPSTIDKNQSLEMEMKEATIQFPSDVLSQITGDGDISISADTVKDADKNAAINNVTDASKKEALQNAPIYDFTVKVGDSTASFNASDENKVAITLFYGFDVADAEGIVIYYLAENGEIEEIRNVVYNEETGEVTFFVSHFSFYAVAYEETQEMRCKRGNHNYSKKLGTQTATCWQFGYTEYQCSGCGRKTIDDIVERENHNFDYQNVIKANPTCENPSWSFVRCTNPGCTATNNVSLEGATGHSKNHAASCTEASICTKCNKVLSPSLGHKWGAWTTITSPTQTTEGSRSHTCKVCGETATETLATLGTVDSIKYESYSDLVNIVLGDLLGLEGGKIQLEAVVRGEDVTINIDTQKTSSGYRISVKGVSDGDEIAFYYNNGIFVALSGSEIAYASEIDNLIPIAIDVYKELLEIYYTMLDGYAVEYLSMAKAIVNQYTEAYGEIINKVLQAAGISYTADDLNALVDSVETLYAYMTLKLGYNTSLNINGEVVMPTADDVKAVLSLFMESSEVGGITTYSFTQQPIYDLINNTIKFLNDHADDSLADFVYFLIEEDVKAYNSSLTSFDAVVDFIAKKFPGTLTVADALELYNDYAKDAGLPSLEELYAVLDSILAGALGGQSIADMVEQFSAMTLDQLVQGIMGSGDVTVEALYDMVKNYAKEYVIGDFEYRGMTVSSLIPMLESYANAIDLTLDLTISLDSEGKLVSLVLNQALSLLNGNSPDSEAIEIDSLKLYISNNPYAVVSFPAAIEEAMPDVSWKYDANGNLIVEGLKDGIDYNFSVMGSGAADFDDILVPDSKISAELGKDVYVLKEEYWSTAGSMGEYLLVNGTYYHDAYAGYCYVISPKNTFKLSDITASITSRINALTEKDKIGNLMGSDTAVYAVKLTDSSETIAIAYKDGDTWMIATQYGYDENNYDYGYEDDSFGNDYDVDFGEIEIGGAVDKKAIIKDEDDYDHAMAEFYVVAPITLDEFVKTIQLGSTVTIDPWYDDYRDVYLVSLGGKNYTRQRMTIRYGNFGQTTSLNGISVGADTIFFNEYKHLRGYAIYSLNSAASSLPEHDLAYEHATNVAIYNAKGEIEFITAVELYLYNKQPSYYLKVADGIYINLNATDYYSSSMNVSGMESIALPDGNVLYVLGETDDNDYGYKYGYKTVYGYAKTAGNIYVQAAVLYDGDSIVDVLYRGAETFANVNPNSLYNVNDYVTEENGTYKISAELIKKLNDVTKVEGCLYAIEIRAVSTVGDYAVEFLYYVGGQANIPEDDIDSLIFGTRNEYSFWEDLFDRTGSGTGYSVVYNDDGSISLVFPMGKDINNLMLNSNMEFPVDSVLTYDAAKSAETGLNIYKFTGSYTSTYVYDYVYKNGKYYNYSCSSNYDLTLTNSIDFKNIWTIRDTRYRFTMVGAEGLEAGIPVYETEIQFNYFYTVERYSYDAPYITAYTFYMDGKMYVAVEAEVTGESLLKFERYMTIDEYIDSLVFVADSDDDYYSERYYQGRLTKIYDENFYIYETDENGNRLADCQYSINASYIKQSGKTMYIINWAHLSDMLHLGNQVNIDATDKSRYEYSTSYYNGVFTIVSFSREQTNGYNAYFVNLAGRMYRYDSRVCYCYNNICCCYDHEKISEAEFNSMNLDKVWYYMVVDENGKQTYYTKFIPSDFGFAPAGDVINPYDIIGDKRNQTLLGYTPEGCAIYEVVYIIDTGDSTEWTEEIQSDGTVFLHKNGVGYLKVNQNGTNYYVEARKVDMADGTTQIYCFVRKGCLTYSEMEQYSDDVIDQYIKIDGNVITITKDFYEIAKNSNRNEFRMQFYAGNYYHFDYYKIEALFEMR